MKITRLVDKIVIDFLAENPWARVQQIQQGTQLKRPTITASVRRLVRDTALERRKLPTNPRHVRARRYKNHPPLTRRFCYRVNLSQTIEMDPGLQDLQWIPRPAASIPLPENPPRRVARDPNIGIDEEHRRWMEKYQRPRKKFHESKPVYPCS